VFLLFLFPLVLVRSVHNTYATSSATRVLLEQVTDTTHLVRPAQSPPAVPLGALDAPSWLAMLVMLAMLAILAILAMLEYVRRSYQAPSNLLPSRSTFSHSKPSHRPFLHALTERKSLSCMRFTYLAQAHF